MRSSTATLLILPLFLIGLPAVCGAIPLSVPDENTVEYPDDEPPSQEEIELGKMLFFDNRLSINMSQSCATCHNPDLGFGDGMKVSIGAKGEKTGRNAPHIYNLAWNHVFFWDGRAASLEDQAVGPIVSGAEMNMPLEVLVARLKTVPEYIAKFEALYGKDSITEKNIAKAITAFERTVVVKNTPFDKYLQGDQDALGPEAKRGLALFEGKANCIKCHDGPNLTDSSFHNIGVQAQDAGRGKILEGPGMNRAFKTPGLRNVILTAPYMHDGSLATLDDVVRFYNRAGDHKEGLDPLIQPLNLTEREISDLLAFLGALTEPLEIVRPSLPTGGDMTIPQEQPPVKE